MFNLRTEPEYVPGFHVRDSDEVPGFRMPVGDAEPHISNGLDLYSPYPFAAIGGSYATSPWQYSNPGADMAVDCEKIIAECHDRCVSRFEIRPFPEGDQFVGYRRCMRDCVAPSGCSY